jgi:single-strand DNA-binding protein
MAGGAGFAGTLRTLGVAPAAADLRRLLMANEAFFAVSGYVATQPKKGFTKGGTFAVSMRVAWTPRVMNKVTGEWADQETSFVSVTCYRKVAENAARCLRRGDPVVLRGTLKVREYTDQTGARRNAVDVVADSLGHDMSRGTSQFTKTPQHAEQTAEEYEWSAAAGRNPLPGDMDALGRPAGEPGDGQESAERARLAPPDDADDEDAPELPDALDAADLEGGQPDAEFAGTRG